MPAMIEVAKLETELASKAGRRSPTDTFIMKKRIKQIVEEERKAGPVPDVCEAITIGGAYET
jgi:hypothetical protein